MIVRKPIIYEVMHPEESNHWLTIECPTATISGQRKGWLRYTLPDGKTYIAKPGDWRRRQDSDPEITR